MQTMRSLMNEEQQQKVVDCLEHWRVVAAMNNIQTDTTEKENGGGQISHVSDVRVSFGWLHAWNAYSLRIKNKRDWRNRQLTDYDISLNESKIGLYVGWALIRKNQLRRQDAFSLLSIAAQLLLPMSL
ncbi:hypothetical protein OUZ56_007488 [Daphnia magna]|uniref:HTH CENPB-type domain-containing protein n=1 Tax=Daphnia magna TaxID=35525 RepID=A0ABR0AA40_9CRUS|nr:hypothetical protein OUZ56_007488 [Daphnia magna]